MAVHIAYIGMVKIDSSGNVVQKTDTIAKNMRASEEQRILPHAGNINTNGYPTIETYLTREDASGLHPVQVFQSMVITST